ncbi:MAG: ammonia-forming cytochrome c nitrite reductase subunit c552 [Verrucomicrobiae bacterium]|nr:ammonia-forming cytochrome c nitrite reductase subunit c552 [Verrucomicrobiae bacterium]
MGRTSRMGIVPTPVNRIPSILPGLAIAVLSLSSCERKEDGATTKRARSPYHAIPGATHVGHESCKTCHEGEFREWLLSDHHKAMSPATEEYVLGDFNDATFEHFGQVFRFFRKGDEYWVNAPDETGTARDMKIDYTFGHYPLQQYLIAFPGGRYQALQVCWDSRPKEEGGQRWYHLYPDEAVPPDDILHWTRRHFNWNYMCADCHSTNLQKGFDKETLSYHTTWSEMNVSCEACHGPGSEHVKWAEAKARTEANPGDKAAATEFAALKDYLVSKGLVVTLKEPGADPNEFPWTTDPVTRQPKRTRPLDSNVQIETCAPCHSHRTLLDTKWNPGQPYHDTHAPSVLSERLYHHDGQLKEETYVYGSFVQSKMFHAGVRCTDCHNPHSMKLVAPGNALCVRCHLADPYDTPAHHFHPVGSTGANCVDCHMPHTTYMGVDARRDHSLRVPRPDLAKELGTPDACTKCHTDQTQEWAADWFRKWWGGGPRNAHYGEILASARRNETGSFAKLAALAGDLDRPALVRAAAVETAGLQGPTPESTRVIASRLSDPDPSVRSEALTALLGWPADQRLALAGNLLEDPSRQVRAEAARVLAAAHSGFSETQKAAFAKAASEFVMKQEAIADRAAGHMFLAAFYQDLGDAAKAEEAYRLAQKVEPEFIPARLNFAEMLYSQNRPAEAEAEFRGAIVAAMTDNDRGLARESLARFLVRQKRYDEGVAELGQAAALLPENPGTQYFYGVALNSLGRFPEALPYLEKARELAPRHLEYLTGLATVCRDAGKMDLALKYAREALALEPDNPQLQSLVRSLGG